MPTSPSLTSSKSGSHPNSARSLDFSTGGKPKAHDSSRKPGAEATPKGNVPSPTWADRVKGITVKPHPPITTDSERRVSEGAVDEDGWETVSRGRVRSAGAITGRRRPVRGSHSSKPEELAATNPHPAGEETGSHQPSPTEGSDRRERQEVAAANPGREASNNQPSPTEGSGDGIESSETADGKEVGERAVENGGPECEQHIGEDGDVEANEQVDGAKSTGAEWEQNAESGGQESGVASLEQVTNQDPCEEEHAAESEKQNGVKEEEREADDVGC